MHYLSILLLCVCYIYVCPVYYTSLLVIICRAVCYESIGC